MPRTILLFIADNESVHLTDYHDAYPQSLGISGRLKRDDEFFQSTEEALEKIRQIIEESQSGKST